MIKFGSRVDVLFKPGTKIKVKKGQKVTGGKTILAEL
jgi:phosphatidylserine decarboxylase